jgi:hypothetical protein
MEHWKAILTADCGLGQYCFSVLHNIYYTQWSAIIVISRKRWLIRGIYIVFCNLFSFTKPNTKLCLLIISTFTTTFKATGFDIYWWVLIMWFYIVMIFLLVMCIADNITKYPLSITVARGDRFEALVFVCACCIRSTYMVCIRHDCA